MTTVLIPLADGFEEIEAVVSIDVLRRAGLNVITVGLESRTVDGAHGIALTADKVWQEVAGITPDVLVLPGGMPGSKNLGKHRGLQETAKRIAAANGWLTAICAAPAFTLANWGLLTGRQATCYPGCETDFPKGVKYVKDSVVVDGRFLTAAGPGAAFPFAFTLVENLLNKATAENLKGQMQYR
ncbi:MAG: DJ-1/PfpI family protein [Planctomycetaceae bacterium]|jgi:4-methyl-5(b-hydroxyethyl)-thiazole monophosphate biosynthesis|nr:DJ-1/PfpI family protein [Planctomycetaceae bacterium]